MAKFNVGDLISNGQFSREVTGITELGNYFCDGQFYKADKLDGYYQIKRTTPEFKVGDSIKRGEQILTIEDIENKLHHKYIFANGCILDINWVDGNFTLCEESHV